MTESALPVYQAYCAVNNRKVRYQVSGNGPTVLVIHGSPQSSTAVLPLVRYLAQQGFCAIAPDTPGYGLSCPLSASTPHTTVDYALALHAFADALGISQYGLYGFHTGAAICCTLAAIKPDAVTALTCEGLTAWTPEEQNTLLQGYLPIFTPSWDGSHMAWAWSRIEEQLVFFPWHVAEDRCQMQLDISPVDRIHTNALDLLQAGNDYRIGYHVAFTFVTEHWLADIQCPQLFVCYQHDPLADHYSRTPFTPYNTQLFSDMPSLYDAVGACLHTQHGTVFSANQQTVTDQNGIQHGWAGKAGESLAFSACLRHGASSPTLVLLPGAGESKAMFNRLLLRAAQIHNVIALDLPGQGDSENLSSPPTTVHAIGKWVNDVLCDLQVHNYRVAGHGLGGRIAAWLVENALAQTGAALCINTLPETDRQGWLNHYAGDLSPQWDGTHLLRAFRIARWERLYAPWYKRTVQARKKQSGQLEPDSIQQRALNMLKAGKAWSAAIAAETTYDWHNCSLPPALFTCYYSPLLQQCDRTVLSSTEQTPTPLGEHDMDWVHAIETLMT